jgi:K+ transporter
MSVVAATEERTVPARAARERRPPQHSLLGIVYGDLGTSPLYTLQAITQIIGWTVCL